MSKVEQFPSLKFLYWLWFASFAAMLTLLVHAGHVESKESAKKLYGEIDVVQSACQSAGLVLNDQKLPTTLKSVVSGSAAAAANLSEGDQIVQAKVESSHLLLEIKRNGALYQAKIDLSADGLVTENASMAGSQSQKSATGVHLNAAAESAAHGGDWFYGAILVDYSTEITAVYVHDVGAGFTAATAREQLPWDLEYHHNGEDGAFHQQWCAVISRSDDFLTGYVKKHIPANFYAKHYYHLLVNRDGSIAKYWLHDAQGGKSSFGDIVQFNKFAIPAITALSNSRLLAAPDGSRIQQWNCGLELSHLHFRGADY